jgi:hypothetical protein
MGTLVREPGDGSFYIKITKSSSHKCGFNVRAAFDITQNSTEIEVLKAIGNKFFNYSKSVRTFKLASHLSLSNLKSLRADVEPFFKKNALLTRKSLDFIIWQEALRLIESKEHLTELGVAKAKELQALQHLHRKQIHPSIFELVLSIRPDWKSRL